MSSFLIMFMFRIFLEINKPEVCSLGSLRGGVGWGFGMMLAGRGDRANISSTKISKDSVLAKWLDSEYVNLGIRPLGP